MKTRGKKRRNDFSVEYVPRRRKKRKEET